jgi:uncharacterized phage protein (TIGR01671 family)
MFRVWDNINKRYDKDLTLIDKDGDVCYQDGGKYCNGEHPEDFTIEQSTGLTDKNGKLIYEGDVLRFTIQIDVCVTFRNGGFVYSLTEDERLVYRLIEVIAKSTQIIGNIHDDQFREVTKMMEATNAE